MNWLAGFLPWRFLLATKEQPHVQYVALPGIEMVRCNLEYNIGNVYEADFTEYIYICDTQVNIYKFT